MTDSEKFTNKEYVFKDGKLIGDWEELYRNVTNPWGQSEFDHIYETRRNIAIRLCEKMRETAGSIKVLELGCGLGDTSKQLTDLNFLTLGTDISSAAISLASKKNPNSVFKVAKFNDFELIYDFNPDIVIMAELTWYILPELDDFLIKLKEYSNSRKSATFLIHSLATYAPGVQKFGTEKFTNYQEILKYFGLNYLESGFISTVRVNDPDSQGTYFLAKL